VLHFIRETLWSVNKTNKIKEGNCLVSDIVSLFVLSSMIQLFCHWVPHHHHNHEAPVHLSELCHMWSLCLLNRELTKTVVAESKVSAALILKTTIVQEPEPSWSISCPHSLSPKFNHNVILPSPYWSFSRRFTHQNTVCIPYFYHSSHMSSPS
jgi:hypothetical protein